MILASDDDGVSNIGMRGEEGLDFTEFDTEAADFDLVVETAEVFEIAIGEIAGEVAGTVEPRAGDGLKGLGMKRSAVRSGDGDSPGRRRRRRHRFRRGRRWEPAAGTGRGLDLQVGNGQRR